MTEVMREKKNVAEEKRISKALNYKQTDRENGQTEGETLWVESGKARSSSDTLSTDNEFPFRLSNYLICSRVLKR